MKKLNFVFLLLISILFACGSGQTDKKSEARSEQEILNSDDSNNKIVDCDDFLDRYEKWIDNYLVLMEKHVKNPTDAKLGQEFMKVAQEASTWTQQWTSNFYVCVTQDKYQKRFEKISDKANKKMKELGLE